MVYTVQKTARGWVLISPNGDTLAVKNTRHQAVTIGKALAGWRGVVVSGDGHPLAMPRLASAYQDWTRSAGRVRPVAA